ncbi:arsenate reductase (glutaredoxin) [Flagellimonas flava]|uniref:Arsenate reductase n=1 Tax=Flagellimonas flava TaxID=570519 RepID=A0A1M5J1I2_9FLAO|nr:arsenate reductase (glutaredoxin) [Allomuricauda flava]SHG34235.1 arsenate reductase [Allomuricauda flava]
MIKIYHNPRCRKSREGLEFLENSGEAFEVVRYLEDVPSIKDLTTVIEFLGISPMELVRKNEAIWKEQYRGKDLTDEEIIKAMIEHPKLIERPIVVKGKKAVVARPADKISNLLES